MDLNRFPDPTLVDGALEIVRTLKSNGHEALFAGGVVRDLLMESKIWDNKDIDIATSAPPEVVEGLFERTVPVGKQFGVILVVIGPHNYEVTTFREDADYLDGRHPSEVSFSDCQRDALRRDFTVNALFLDPIDNTILDFVNGKKDLAAGLLRTVGRPEQRFSEDKLRVIRAIRFACQLGFRIEEKTWQQVMMFAELTRQVSWERIRDEIKRIFTGPRPALGLQLLLDSGILKVILPEVAEMVGVQQPPQFHPEGDVFVHTKKLFELAEPPLDPVLALAMLLHDVGKPPTFTVEDRIRFNGHAEVGAEMARKICDRFRFSTDFTERVVALVKDHLRFIPVKQMRESTLKRFLRMPHFDQHLELHRLDCLASHKDLSSYQFCKEKLEELSEEEMRPKPFLNGHDLIAQGITPGPVFSQILRELEDLQLEGRILSRQEALTWIKERLSKT